MPWKVAYFGRLDDTSPFGVVMKQDRVANNRKRGVLWTDSVVNWDDGGGVHRWYSNHSKGMTRTA